MDTNDKVRLLIRLARKCPDDSSVLLVWAEELLQGTSEIAQPHSIGSASPVAFPVPIFILAKGRKIDGVLYQNRSIQVDGRSYRSPSGAASSELGYLENGWRVWKFRDAEGKIQPINLLRGQHLI